jgi:hypothetical protein
MSASPPNAAICDAAGCTLWANSGQGHSYSITSSASASSDGGTSRPIAFAVFRLMTSSYLVAACTGSSAGFSPFSIRSTYPAANRNCSTLLEHTFRHATVVTLLAGLSENDRKREVEAFIRDQGRRRRYRTGALNHCKGCVIEGFVTGTLGNGR